MAPSSRAQHVIGYYNYNHALKIEDDIFVLV